MITYAIVRWRTRYAGSDADVDVDVRVGERRRVHVRGLVAVGTPPPAMRDEGVWGRDTSMRVRAA